MDALLPLFLLMAVVCIALIFLTKFSSQNLKPQHSYQLRSHLLSPAERSFFGVLQQAVKDHYVVFSKVRVADVLTPTKGLSRSNWQSAFNQISAKHFDFVLCDPKDLSIKSVLELDDKSHQQAARVKRDNFIVSICKEADLNFYQFQAKQKYSVEDIRQRILPTRQ